MQEVQLLYVRLQVRQGELQLLQIPPIPTVPFGQALKQELLEE